MQTTDDHVLRVITGESCFDDWIIAIDAALLVLRTDSFNLEADFELSFKADGEDARCSFSNPITYEQPSGIFTDGTSSQQEMWRSSVCKYIIKPSGNPSRVTMYFNRLGIKSTGTITVYDGFELTPEYVIFVCNGCREVAPSGERVRGLVRGAKRLSAANIYIYII